MNPWHQPVLGGLLVWIHPARTAERTIRVSSVKKVVVIGQGYVGLPVAMAAVNAGFSVVGIDLDRSRVGALERSVSYVDDVTDDELRAARNSGRYLATTNYEDAHGFEVAVITVPTPLRDSLPDLQYIESSGASLAPLVTSGSTVILESTTYPGTTDELLVPILEAGSGLTAGSDFHVGYSPERIDPGNQVWTFTKTPKVVSGVTPESLERVESFYAKLVDTTVPVAGTREAEMSKLLENTFRHVNIALVNELAVFANQLGVDVWEAIRAASTKPFGFMKFTPGPGVGGHCLPVDPSYLSWQVRQKLGQSFRFVELANDINDHMPSYVVTRLIRALNRRERAVKGARILLVGLSYKKNSGDTRESPSLKVAQLLSGLEAELLACDPHVEEARWPSFVERVDLTDATVRSMDAVIVLADHDVLDLTVLEQTGPIILDTRHVVHTPTVEHL